MTHHVPQMPQPGYPQPGYPQPGYQIGGPAQQSLPVMPPDNKGWAIATIIFFWPLAFSAFSHSSKVYPLWAAGDFTGSQAASDRTKKLGKIALIVWAVFMVVGIVLWIAVFAAAMSAVNDIPSYTDYSYR
ncbi:MAG: CD225/dispanin family protein [Rhodococcus sp. (in: high G+C Gram-positive bacteria)]|uniref:CD225/dispanin family protein n=1 Tax=Rhodococcus sp. TaxID=1831 RepID=UPI003BB4CAB9